MVPMAVRRVHIELGLQPQPQAGSELSLGLLPQGGTTNQALAIGCDLLAHEVHAASLPEDKLCLFGILQAFLQVAHPTHH